MAIPLRREREFCRRSAFGDIQEMTGCPKVGGLLPVRFWNAMWPKLTFKRAAKCVNNAP